MLDREITRILSYFENRGMTKYVGIVLGFLAPFVRDERIAFAHLNRCLATLKANYYDDVV